MIRRLSGTLFSLHCCLRLVQCQSDPQGITQSNFKDRVPRRTSDSTPGSESLLSPSWETWQQSMPVCTSSANLSDGLILRTEHGDFVYEPTDCYLRRLTADEARRCLKGRHVAFIGDSITRYQYISLAYFLSKKRPLERHGNLRGSPSLTWEKEWPTWEEYFARGSAILAGAVEGCAEEECDCHRPERIGRRALHGTLREFRRFSLEFPYPCSIRHPLKQDRLTLSFYVTFGQPEKDDSEVGGEALQYHANHILEGPATDVVYNEGLWMIDNGWPADRMEAFLAKMTTKMLAFQKAHNGTSLLYKTSTPYFRRHAEPAKSYHAKEILNAREAGINITDAFAVLQALLRAGLGEKSYVDEAHFRPFVYEQLNDVLLNQLCPSDGG